jgi:hypothetical protein
MFVIRDANAQEIPISVKSYNGDISNFSFDESSERISYEILHDDKSEYLDSSDVKQIVSIGEEFSNFKPGYHIDVLVNGIQIAESLFDVDGSIPGDNIIRIDIPYDEFDMAYGASVSNDVPSITKIELVSGEQIEFGNLDFAYDNGYSASVMWDSESFSGKEIPFIFSFFDQSNNPVKDILFAYSITDESGSEIWSNIGTHEMYLGVLAPYGIAQESIMIPTDGEYKIKLILTGQNSGNFESFMISDSSFSISSQNEKSEKKDAIIPAWIKSNAGWWADGQIDDGSFVEGM